MLRGEDFEVPDSGYDVLDRVAELLVRKDTISLTHQERVNLDIMLSELLTAIHLEAEKMADQQLVPGKIAESVLEKTIKGYREARTLATFLEGVLR